MILRGVSGKTGVSSLQPASLHVLAKLETRPEVEGLCTFAFPGEQAHRPIPSTIPATDARLRPALLREQVVDYDHTKHDYARRQSLVDDIGDSNIPDEWQPDLRVNDWWRIHLFLSIDPNRKHYSRVGYPVFFS
jgi:hypothetical protein